MDSGARRWHGRCKVGLRKVVTLEEKRLAEHRRECVGKAVSEVEPSSVATLAESAEGLTRFASLISIDGGDLDLRSFNEQVEVA